MVHNDIKQQTILTVGSSHAGSRNICGFKQYNLLNVTVILMLPDSFIYMRAMGLTYRYVPMGVH
jgi:hypothetical protein